MVTYSEIEANLQELDRLFINAKTPQHELFYAKLAVMELGGWIELTLDNITESLRDKHIKSLVHKRAIDEKIKTTYGFDYDSHFLGMLSVVIGRKGVEEMDNTSNLAKLIPLSPALKDFKGKRDVLAHTFLKGATTTIDAPSSTIIRFKVILAGLLEVERILI